jgi:hypothetical protein
MSEASARFDLPFIIPGQAQKEMFHNEALARIDAALHAVVEVPPLIQPPEVPEVGQSWILGSAPVGAWEGKADQLATWTAGGWRFVAPVPGMAVWCKSECVTLQWSGTGWTLGAIACRRIEVGGQQVVGDRQPAVPSPSGGTIIDAEARSAIAAITAALMSHGLID